MIFSPKRLRDRHSVILRSYNENISRTRRSDNLGLSQHFKPSLQSAFCTFSAFQTQFAFYTDRFVIAYFPRKITSIYGQRYLCTGVRVKRYAECIEYRGTQGYTQLNKAIPCRGGGGHPMIGYSERLRPKGVPFHASGI